eukprot:756846-Hanusia_phi.AAC.3
MSADWTEAYERCEEHGAVCETMELGGRNKEGAEQAGGRRSCSALKGGKEEEGVVAWWPEIRLGGHTGLS